MIPAEFKADVIQSGISFMRSITEAYGSDEGMKLWDTIASTLDPDIKGQIFFAMITGEYTTGISISSTVPGANKVALIKALRSVDSRMLGLKEAKDMVDLLSSNNTIKVEFDPQQRNIALQELRTAGFHV